MDEMKPAMINSLLQLSAAVKLTQDDYLRHEALDRMSVVAAMVDTHVLEHEWVQENAQVLQMVGDASDLLWRAYQLIGQAIGEEK